MARPKKVKAEAPPKPPEIEVGCWVKTPYHDRAVCTDADVDFVSYRYEAVEGDGSDPNAKTLWVQNGDYRDECEYISPPDEQSLWVCTLTGPYGVEP